MENLAKKDKKYRLENREMVICMRYISRQLVTCTWGFIARAFVST